MKKIIRVTTISRSLEDFCKDILRELSQNYEVIGLSSLGPELEIVKKREGGENYCSSNGASQLST